jgi:hypothetical protein
MIDNAAKGCLVAGLVALGLSGPAWTQRAGAQQAEQRATAELYRLDAAGAARIERELRGRIAEWRQLARAIGFTGGDLERLASVILTDGV